MASYLSEFLLLALPFCPQIYPLGQEFNMSQFPEAPGSQFHLYLSVNMVIPAPTTFLEFSNIDFAEGGYSRNNDTQYIFVNIHKM